MGDADGKGRLADKCKKICETDPDVSRSPKPVRGSLFSNRASNIRDDTFQRCQLPEEPAQYKNV